MSSQPRIEIQGQAPFKQSGVYEAQISVFDTRPSDDELRLKKFNPLWQGNFHLKVKDGIFSEIIGDAKNPLPASVDDLNLDESPALPGMRRTGRPRARRLANLDLQDNQVEDMSALSGLTELRFTFLQNNQIKDFTPLIEMAKKDAAGERRFAPYWKLYPDGNPIDAAQRDKQLAALKKIGIRINWKPKK